MRFPELNPLSSGTSPGFTFSFQKSYFDNGRREAREKFVHEHIIPYASGMLLRKSVFEWVSGADKSMVFCGDWFLWLKMLSVSDVYFIAEPLNTYRLYKYFCSFKIFESSDIS